VNASLLKVVNDIFDVVFHEPLVQYALIIAGAAVGLVIVIGLVRRLFRTTAASPLFQPVRCRDCGWRGQVSRYAGRCPQCNQPLGEQKGKRGR